MIIEDKYKSSSNQDMIDLSKLASLLKKNINLILVSTIVFTIFGFLYANTLPIKYKSDATLIIRDSESNQGVSSLSMLLNNGSGNKKRELFIETLKSRNLSEIVHQNENILRDLLAIKHFDIIENKPLYDEEVYDINAKDFKVQTNVNWINGYTNAGLKIQASGQTFIKISFEHPSPIFARDYIYFLVEMTNDLIRDKSLTDADAALDFLNMQIETASNSSIKISASQLIQNQLDFKMKADIHKDYIASFINKPHIPSSKHSPNKKLYILITAILGLLGSVFLVILNSVTIKTNRIFKT
jgi:LPS O-antigen subunit length determinant protein (WzzB/FepE family)